MEKSFDIVYYPRQFPDLHTLSFLALLFDKIHLPGVYINIDGLTEKVIIEHINELKTNITDSDSLLFCRAAIFSSYCLHLKDLFVFNGKPGQMGTLENGANELAKAIEELYFGPPKEGFFPILKTGYNLPLPGNRNSCIDAPGEFTYPANALLYSSKNDIPLLNDDPSMPIPGIPSSASSHHYKSNVTALSSIMAFECIKLMLPKIKMMPSREIMDFRHETKEFIKPFRMEMLKLAKDLNSEIKPEMTVEEIRKEAAFLAETTVIPALNELEQNLNNPSKPWYERAMDTVKDTPQMVAAFATMPTNLAVANMLGKLGSVLVDVNHAQKEKEKKIKRTGFYYLLKLKNQL